MTARAIFDTNGDAKEQRKCVNLSLFLRVSA
jgi:hypothetical protein